MTKEVRFAPILRVCLLRPTLIPFLSPDLSQPLSSSFLEQNVWCFRVLKSWPIIARFCLKHCHRWCSSGVNMSVVKSVPVRLCAKWKVGLGLMHVWQIGEFGSWGVTEAWYARLRFCLWIDGFGSVFLFWCGGVEGWLGSPRFDLWCGFWVESVCVCMSVQRRKHTNWLLGLYWGP